MITFLLGAVFGGSLAVFGIAVWMLATAAEREIE
jgi:hypothetical protein